MMTDILQKLIRRENLSEAECIVSMNHLFSGEAPEISGAFLGLMQAKGLQAEELSAMVKMLKTHQKNFRASIPCMDLVGTGGDGANTVNISTAASLLVSACGVPVLKHGNRSASSQSGSADLIEALGLPLNQEIEDIQKALTQTGFAFCYAPHFTPILSQVKSLRSSVKFPTFFNLIGPLLNPGQPEILMIGVADTKMMQLMSNSLKELPIKRAMIVHGSGLDELSCLGICEVIEHHGDKITHYQIDPLKFGFQRCGLKDLQGSSANQNASLIKQVFAGEENPLSETILLNAGTALYLYGKTKSIAKGISLAHEVLSSGAVLEKIEEIRGINHG